MTPASTKIYRFLPKHRINRELACLRCRDEEGSPPAATLEPAGGLVAAIVVAEMLFEEVGSLAGLAPWHLII